MISMIVPIYKVERFLPRCVDSILNQTFLDFELILVDDGSPDRCGEICDQYAQADSRIRVIHKENGGLSDARNTGLAAAQGDYISFVDSDDWLSPKYLEKLLSGLQQADADICECEIFRTEGDSIPEAKTNCTSLQIYETTAALEQLIKNEQLHQYVWNKLYRKSILDGIVFPKGKLNEDDFWTYQVFARAKKVAKTDAVLYCYFQRPGSIMNSGYTLKNLDHFYALLERQQFIEAHFHSLSEAGRIDLLFSAYYHGVKAMEYLNQSDRKIATGILTTALEKYPISEEMMRHMKSTHKFWTVLSRKNFSLGCRLRKYLKIG